MAGDYYRMMQLTGPYIQILLLVELIALALYVPLLALLWFAPALVMLADHGVYNAMRDSLVGCVKNIIPFLVYGVIGLIFSIIATLPVFLGWLVLLPMFCISVYLSYQDIYQKPD
jgi:uncharacterized membrane protein